MSEEFDYEDNEIVGTVEERISIDDAKSLGIPVDYLSVEFGNYSEFED